MPEGPSPAVRFGGTLGTSKPNSRYTWVQLGMDLCCIATQFLPSRQLQLAVQLQLEPAELQFDWLGDAAGWGGTNCEEPYEQVGWGVCLLGRH